MEHTGMLNNHRNRESALDHVFHSIVNAIINGELTPGSKLPTELELSQSLGVGRNSVREAIKILEAYGVVSIRRPEGTFVCDSYHPNMLNPMLYGLLLQNSDWSDLIQLRGVLEIGTLFSACHKANADDVAHLNDTVEELRQELASPNCSAEKILEIDRCFHAYIVEIAQSKLVLDVSEYITRITLPSRKRTIESVIEKNEMDHFIAKHEDIVAVVQNRAFQDIDRVVMSHYEYWIRTEESL